MIHLLDQSTCSKERLPTANTVLAGSLTTASEHAAIPFSDFVIGLDEDPITASIPVESFVANEPLEAAEEDFSEPLLASNVKTEETDCRHDLSPKAEVVLTPPQIDQLTESGETISRTPAVEKGGAKPGISANNPIDGNALVFDVGLGEASSSKRPHPVLSVPAGSVTKQIVDAQPSREMSPLTLQNERNSSDFKHEQFVTPPPKANIETSSFFQMQTFKSGVFTTPTDTTRGGFSPERASWIAPELSQIGRSAKHTAEIGSKATSGAVEKTAVPPQPNFSNTAQQGPNTMPLNAAKPVPDITAFAKANYPEQRLSREPSPDLPNSISFGTDRPEPTVHHTFTSKTHRLIPAGNLQAISEAALVLRESAGRIDVTLAPEELGRLSIKLDQTPQGPLFTFSAERGETQDLIRRHLEQLHEQFREMGFENATFSFGEQGSASTENPEMELKEVGFVDSSHKTLEIIEVQSFGPPNGIDIRI